ncbi:unnamed protein product [Euphydryas editha]|uniref:Reverse transcriptase domain-containing protein n=1 Tax=Euphydryas editha TaxID=104508 RepID=A0AAU9UJH5_EUPED|nr:unnamed protein product [Euphydryas editha]
MAKRSTNTNLILFTSELKETVDQNVQVDAIYTDFLKDFDRVNHKILIGKLQRFEITDNLLDDLTNRCSKVVVDGKESQPFTASSGIPQGAVLGPLFFNVFINNITRVINLNDVCFFADDLKLMKPVRNHYDIKCFQDDINDWCTKNNMSLNTSKCQHIKYTRRRCKLQSEYFIDRQKLHEVTTIRDLGILMD